MTDRDVFLICFAAAAVIHGAQTVLAAKLLPTRTGGDRREVIDGIAIGVLTFLWQFGNFLAGFASTVLIGNVLRHVSLVVFPLLFSYMCLHIPTDSRRAPHLFVRAGQYLRYPLWPWTFLAVAAMATDDLGVEFPILGSYRAAQITLHIMLVYFLIFTAATVSFRTRAHASGVGALVRAYKATLIASVLGVVTFVLMLSGYWKLPIPFLQYIELAAMLTSVPFTISIAYRLYQFPFMDGFVREVLSGVILLAAFAGAVAVNHSVLWITMWAVLLAYFKAPLTRWVERTFMGYEESAEQQEERIGNAIRGLSQIEGFAGRVAEILTKELEAEWVEISSKAIADSALALEIPGAGLLLCIGHRIGQRQYMSRQLRVARTAALELAAHHHQLKQRQLRELTARAEIRALRAQINPHFLFNTLNVLANLIHSDPEKAERVTEELAEIFRYALESTRVEWVALSEELDFLESYLGIEKARFEERLSFSIDADAIVRSLKIPPMILQPLVENAIKHGIGPKVDGGTVKIAGRAEVDRVVMIVEDTGIGRRNGSRSAGTGIGLQNVRERIQQLYGEAASLRLEDVQPSGTRVTLILPQVLPHVAGVPS